MKLNRRTEPPQTFLALDVEISSRSPLQICAIGAIRVELGQEIATFESLVHTEGRVRYTHVHGIARTDLLRAPRWPVVWRGVSALLSGVTDVVAFNAAFDRSAILATSAMHGVRLPPIRFICAAALAARRYGWHLSLSETLTRLGLTYPGRAHKALDDARAAALLALTCWREEAGIDYSVFKDSSASR